MPLAQRIQIRVVHNEDFVVIYFQQKDSAAVAAISLSCLVIL
jgi:hypothetical protein